ncbi:MAG: DUF362 domain-containing protein [Planctomycetota bacterium]|nr:DUF362 domain-containing protein [Planctomycetota bacterium]
MNNSIPTTRRGFLTAAGALTAVGLGARAVQRADESHQRADVFIAHVDSYQDPIERSIREGLVELGFGPVWARGKTVLLKPNLVEPTRDAPHVNTHPLVVRAAAEVFRSWGARRVVVAEGPGHCRDIDYVLDESQFAPMLASERLDFVDLNFDEYDWMKNKLNRTTLGALALPASILNADLIVSMPKMKTHHWVGVTLSMKNLFGVLPGCCYGWPKNVLHHAGITESILDLNATVRPHLAIIDGIVGMEGDGPIMGTPKHAGVLVMGANLPAVDATAARLMGVDPWTIAHLAGSSGKLGPIAESHIRQRGELINPQPFRTLTAM